jgi:hypothetical protein
VGARKGNQLWPGHQFSPPNAQILTDIEHLEAANNEKVHIIGPQHQLHAVPNVAVPLTEDRPDSAPQSLIRSYESALNSTAIRAFSALNSCVIRRRIRTLGAPDPLATILHGVGSRRDAHGYTAKEIRRGTA